MLPTDYIEPDEHDREIFDATVPADDYLRRVKEVIDFDRFRDDLATCYSRALGRPAIEPVLLLKLEFLQFHYKLSDREVVKRARRDMGFRLFLELSLHSSLPDDTSLSKFRQRLGVEHHQRVFEEVVAQARGHGLVKDRLRLKDATHVIANIAIPSTIRLVAQTRERVLAAVRPYAPERVAAEEAQAGVIRTATADLPGDERLLQRVTHLRTIVSWVDELLAQWPAEQQPHELAEAVRLAHKVLADREPKAADKIISLQDPDARWRKHHGAHPGYALDISMDADSEIVTAVNVMPGNGDEAVDAVTLIQQEEAAQHNDVQGLSMDSAGFRGSVLRELTDPDGLNVEVFVPSRGEPPTETFAVEQFTLDSSGQVLTCPAGATTSRRTRDKGNSGTLYFFKHATCAACPLQKQCVDRLPKNTGRTVYKSDYEAEYRAARAKAQTPEFEEVRRKHWRVERKLGEIVRWHDGRHARYRRQPRVFLQELMTTVVVNIKRMVCLLAQTVRAEPATAT
jgi:transposase